MKKKQRRKSSISKFPPTDDGEGVDFSNDLRRGSGGSLEGEGGGSGRKSPISGGESPTRTGMGYPLDERDGEFKDTADDAKLKGGELKGPKAKGSKSFKETIMQSLNQSQSLLEINSEKKEENELLILFYWNLLNLYFQDHQKELELLGLNDSENGSLNGTINGAVSDALSNRNSDGNGIKTEVQGDLSFSVVTSKGLYKAAGGGFDNIENRDILKDGLGNSQGKIKENISELENNDESNSSKLSRLKLNVMKYLIFETTNPTTLNKSTTMKKYEDSSQTDNLPLENQTKIPNIFRQFVSQKIMQSWDRTVTSHFSCRNDPHQQRGSIPNPSSNQSMTPETSIITTLSLISELTNEYPNEECQVLRDLEVVVESILVDCVFLICNYLEVGKSTESFYFGFGAQPESSRIDSHLFINKSRPYHLPVPQTAVNFDEIFYSLELDADLSTYSTHILEKEKERLAFAQQLTVSTTLDGSHDPPITGQSQIDLKEENNYDDHDMDHNNKSTPLTITMPSSATTPNPAIDPTAPHGIKYLLGHLKLTHRLSSTNHSLSQLNSIITESRPTSSKWSSATRESASILYASLERVLQVLKGYTPHCLVFLRPVLKREAPGYHDIIKQPMDLTTMHKRLRSGKPPAPAESSGYKTKREFAADLDLIWGNCLRYNTAAESVYRVHALAMREKSRVLLEGVVDEEEEEEGEDDDDGMAVVSEALPSNDAAAVVGSNIPEAGSFIEQERAQAEIRADTTEILMQVDVNSVNVDMNVDGDAVDLPAPPLINRNEHQGEGSEREQEEGSETSEVLTALSDQVLGIVSPCYMTRAYKKATNVTRALRLIDAEKRDPALFGGWNVFLGQESVDGYVSAYDARVNRVREPKYTVAGPFLPELLPFSVPGCHGLLEACRYTEGEGLAGGIPSAPLQSLSEYKETQMPVCSLTRAFMSNIENYKRIKELYGRIVERQTVISGNSGIVKDKRLRKPRGYVKCWNLKQEQLPRFHLTGSAAGACLRRVIGEMLMNVGVDACSESVVQVFTDILARVLWSLADEESVIVGEYVDESGFGTRNISIMGNTLNDLNDYVDRDVYGYGRKLQELRARLESAWDEYKTSTDLVMGLGLKVDDKDAKDQDKGYKEPTTPDKLQVEFEDRQTEFASGRFLQASGVDFLDLKGMDLGIEMCEGFKIPTMLWEGVREGGITARVKRPIVAGTGDARGDKKDGEEVYSVDPWKPVNPAAIIGLLAPMYSRLSATQTGMIEDEINPKSKEAKLLMKYAMGGGRKKILVTTSRKKTAGVVTAEGKKSVVKKERKKKKKSVSNSEKP